MMQKSRFSNPRKTASSTSSHSAPRRARKRSSKPRIHVAIRRSFGDKVGVSATVEESGIKFNNMFTVDDQRHTKSTIPACHVAPCTEPTFLEPETFPPDEVQVPTPTETGTHPGANVQYPPLLDTTFTYTPERLHLTEGGLSPGASEESGIQFCGGEHYRLATYSAGWPSGEGLQHEQAQIIDNETAQGARFGIVYDQTYSCGRNAHEHVGYLCESETTNTPWGHTNAYTYYPPPSAHIWQERQGLEGPVSIESAAGWDGYHDYAPTQDIANTQTNREPDPRLTGYYNHDLPGAHMHGAATQPASMEGFDTISPHASGSVQSRWEATDTSTGPSYQGVFSTWY
ncbi:hypothetical protein C8Q78DRAFT_1144236 [Trametes maxima]|nr:hypothetical protein C8Q78DRAFT_1144236 [Trametes maxima]